MNELRKNKSAQFIAGCLTIALAVYLYRNGVFDYFLNDEPPEGMESASLTTLVISSIVSAVNLIGILALGVVFGVLKPLAEWCVDAVSARFPAAGEVADDVKDAIDIDKLIKVLNDLDERLRKVEESKVD